MRLVERDYEILREIDRWRVVVGRQIRELCGFAGGRACDRRLKILADAGYLERRYVLYGIPGLYCLTHAAKVLLDVSTRKEKIRVDKIKHDIAVLDAVLFFMKRFSVPLTDFVSEKELHQKDGFGVRAHKPDFVFSRNGKRFAVEIELSAKATVRFLGIVESNFSEFDGQIWVVPKDAHKVNRMLNCAKEKFTGIEILELEEVQGAVYES